MEPPPRAMDAAVALALEHYDLDGARATFILASENTVYRLDTADGARYVLRVHRPGYHSLAALESESAWTTALSDAGIETPRPRSTRNGSRFATVPYGNEGETRYVGLMEWIEGELLQDVAARADAHLEAVLGGLGGLMARMHTQAVGFETPPGFVRHVLDGEGLIGDDPWWGPFWHVPEFSSNERPLILDARSRIRRALERYGTGRDVFSLIHADLLPTNVLVRTDGRVSAIDFDDTAFGWHLYDIAVALHEFTQHARFDQLRAAFLAGYRQHRSLAEEDVALLPLFLLIRCMVEIGWFDSRLQGHLTYRRGASNDRETLIAPLARQVVSLAEQVLPTL